MAPPPAPRYVGAALAAVFLLIGCEPRPTRATLQGEWGWTGLVLETGRYAEAAFSFRGDSVLDLSDPGAPWRRYRLRGSTLTIGGERGFTMAFDGDTLVLALLARGPYARPRRFTRLPPLTTAPRPDRIVFSGVGGSGRCLTLDLEIDSTGTVRYEGRCGDLRPAPYDGPRPRSGRYEGAGHRALYDRLSRMAAAARADTTHVDRWGGTDDYRVTLVLE